MGNCFDKGPVPIVLSKEEKLRTETGSKFQQMRAECTLAIHDSLQKILVYEKKAAQLAAEVKRTNRPPTIAHDSQMTDFVTQLNEHKQRVERERKRYNALNESENKIRRLIDAKIDAEFHTLVAKSMSRMGFSTEAAERDLTDIEEIYDRAEEFSDEVESSLRKTTVDQEDIEQQVKAAWQMDISDAPQVPPNAGQELADSGFRVNRRRGWAKPKSSVDALLHDESQPIELEQKGHSEVVYDFSQQHGGDDPLVAEFGA